MLSHFVFAWTRPDTIYAILPDSIVVANLPLVAKPNHWWFLVSDVLPILVTAALSFLAAHGIYERQRKHARQDQMLRAYHLLYALCDEMCRARERVWNIIEHSENQKYLKGPIVLPAMDALLKSLVEAMPTTWEPHIIFRFYEMMAIIASHHNRAALLPALPQGRGASAQARAFMFQQPVDNVLAQEEREIADARVFAVNFSLFYYDREEGDSLTSLYLEALELLNDLAEKAKQSKSSRLAAPSKADRAIQYAVIQKRMPPREAPKPPYEGI